MYKRTFDYCGRVLLLGLPVLLLPAGGLVDTVARQARAPLDIWPASN